MTNKTFDTLRLWSEQILPAISALWLSVSRIWHLPYGMEIALTISAVALCLGTIIGIKRAMYNAVDESELAKEVNEDGNEE